MFAYQHPTYIESPGFIEIGLPGIKTTLDFFFYSVSTITTSGFSGIHTTSRYIYLLNTVEIIYGIVIVSIFIATFIQKINENKNITQPPK
jgi:hypothetical protein